MSESSNFEDIKNVSDHQIQNLKAAANWIKDNVPEDRFDMGLYWDTAIWSDNANYGCGTVACFIGWCPRVQGLEPISTDMMNAYEPNWIRYSDRVFGLPGGLWEFCFSSNWQEHDNTIEGAVDRVEKVVTLFESQDYSALYLISETFKQEDDAQPVDMATACNQIGYVPPYLRG